MIATPFRSGPKKMSDVIGELHEPEGPKEVEWKIHDLLSLSFAGSHNGYYSPNFTFAGSSWMLRVYKNDDRNNCLTVLLVKEGSISSEVTCSLSIKKADGTLFGTDIADLTSFHWFRDFIKVPVLQEREFELLPAGALTITCVLESRAQSERKRRVSEKETKSNKRRAVEDEEHKERADTGSLRQMYKQVLLDGQNHDVILKVGDKEFSAHRDILRARSRVFESLLNHNMQEKNSGVVDVPDCDPKAMEQFLLYVYCGKVETLDESNMFGLFFLADKYDMPALKEESRNFILKSMSPTNICGVIQVALNHKDSNLQERATEHFCINLGNILNTAGWQTFIKENFTLANDLLKKAVYKLENPKAMEQITLE